MNPAIQTEEVETEVIITPSGETVILTTNDITKEENSGTSGGNSENTTGSAEAELPDESGNGSGAIELSIISIDGVRNRKVDWQRRLKG